MSVSYFRFKIGAKINPKSSLAKFSNDGH